MDVIIIYCESGFKHARCYIEEANSFVVHIRYTSSNKSLQPCFYTRLSYVEICEIGEIVLIFGRILTDITTVFIFGVNG